MGKVLGVGRRFSSEKQRWWWKPEGQKVLPGFRSLWKGGWLVVFLVERIVLAVLLAVLAILAAIAVIAAIPAIVFISIRKRFAIVPNWYYGSIWIYHRPIMLRPSGLSRSWK